MLFSFLYRKTAVICKHEKLLAFIEANLQFQTSGAGSCCVGYRNGAVMLSKQELVPGPLLLPSNEPDGTRFVAAKR
jgi:hypothetical protein